MTDRPQILQTKEKLHGDFTVNATVSVALKSIIANGWEGDCPDTINEVCDLLCTKLARITAGNALAREHWEDIIGYAQLALEECDRQSVKYEESFHNGNVIFSKPRPTMKPISEMTDDELADELRPEAG